MLKLQKPLHGPRRLLALLLAPLLMFFLGATSAAAVGTITFDGSPGTGAPPAMLDTYDMVPAPADIRAPFDSVSDVPMANGTLTFGAPLSHLQVGSSWATWSHGYTGDVYYAAGTSVTMTLPVGTGAFYFYVEPNQFGDFTITATADDGATSGPVTVNGNAGARYFGFYAPVGSTIATVTVTGTDPSGFAVGEFATAMAPLGGAPQGDDWMLAPLSAVDPAVDKGDYTDANGDGWAVYREAPGATKHDGGVIWKDNDNPFKG